MVLVIAGEGPLATAVLRGAERRAPSRLLSPDHDDLFGSALGHEAIVYAPAPNLLRGRLEPAPDRDRVRRVLGATQAPGVQLLVMIAPPGYEEEELAIRKYGKPYVILRSPPLLEELALEGELTTSGSVWLPRGRSAVVGAAEAVARAAIGAIDDDALQGNTLDAPSERIDAAEALARAARLAGRSSVHPVAPALDRLVRAVPRLLGLRPTPVEGLLQRIASTTA